MIYIGLALVALEPSAAPPVRMAAFVSAVAVFAVTARGTPSYRSPGPRALGVIDVAVLNGTAWRIAFGLRSMEPGLTPLAVRPHGWAAVPERANAPTSPIGNAATAGLLLAYFLVALSGPVFFGADAAPTTLIWPASGVGLAVVLLRGTGVWPLIFAVAAARSVLMLYGSPVPVLVGSALVSGATAVVEPVLGAWLIWRLVGEAFLQRAVPFTIAVLVAAPIAALTSTILPILGTLAGGLTTTYSALAPIATWHIAAVSHLMALLTLTPPILLWMRDRRLRLGPRPALELVALASLAALALAVSAPAQPRYLLVAAHLAIALRLPLKWSALAVSISSLVYLWQATSQLRGDPATEMYLFFLEGIGFVIILNVTTYVAALLHRETRERTDQLQGLTRELGFAEHRERRRIARTLHDHFQQVLVAARMALEQHMRRGDEAAGKRAHSLVTTAIADARSLAVELHPVVLDSRGLAAAMHWLAEDFDRLYGIHVQVEADIQAEPDMPEVASFLYQSTRELLLNVVKHAGTDTASLLLRQTGGRWEVTVEDRGQGHAAKEGGRRPPGHYGLDSIRQRIELLGGSFHIATDKGWRITMSVPLRIGADPEGGNER